MDDVAIVSDAFWRGRSVFVTGHTGFKGAWLSLWLHALGARVHGYALDPVTSPNLVESVRLALIAESDTRADIADLHRLTAAVGQAQPSIVFHLAAQSLVRESYRDPLGTFATNILGTAHILEAVRLTPSVRAVVIVTTDKVYLQRDGARPYREEDPLGGHDPYSASKAAAEIITASYRASFLRTGDREVHVATARAGNVIGGGDWAADRLIPDCVRGFMKGQPVSLRYPHAVRPWQHVLEPLSGYLQLAERLIRPDGARYAQAWNFGPAGVADVTVGEVARVLADLWGRGASVLEASAEGHPHEAEQLRLDSSAACRDLEWRPRWSLRDSLERTIAWYRAWEQHEDMAETSARQIAEYAGASAV